MKQPLQRMKQWMADRRVAREKAAQERAARETGAPWWLVWQQQVQEAQDAARMRPTWGENRLEREYVAELEREEARREHLLPTPAALDYDEWYADRKAAYRRIFARASEE